MGAESDIDIDALIGPPGDAVGATELADFLGLSTRTVRELAERGVIRRCGKNRFPMRESIRAYCASLRETAAARSSTGTQAVERLRWDKARADSQEMKNAAMRRQLVPTAEVERAWGSILRDVRAAMLAIPARIQQQLGTLTPHDVDIIDREVRTALEETAGNHNSQKDRI